MTPLLTTKQVASLLQVSTRTVRDWSETGDFPAPAVNVNRTKRWHPEDVNEWIQKHRPRRAS